MIGIYENSSHYFSGYPLHIQVSLYIILICTVLLISISIGIFMRRVNGVVFSRRVKLTTELVASELFNALEDSEKHWNPALSRMHEKIGYSNFQRQNLLDTLIY